MGISELLSVVPPEPWSRDAAFIEVVTPIQEDVALVDELYSGRTRYTVPDWRGFPLADVEAELFGLDDISVQDFVWGGLGDIIISERLRRIFQEEGITGFDTRSVRIISVRVNGHDWLEERPEYQPPVLYRLVAKGIIEGAPKDVPPPDPAWPLILDLEKWDGSDVCVAWDAWLLFFFSQRFVDGLQRHNVRNYRAIPGREFVHNGHRYIAFRTDD